MRAVTALAAARAAPRSALVTVGVATALVTTTAAGGTAPATVTAGTVLAAARADPRSPLATIGATTALAKVTASEGTKQQQ